MKITQNFIKEISEDFTSLEGTSTNVTRLGAEDLQTPPQGLQKKRQLSNWFIDLYKATFSECRC